MGMSPFVGQKLGTFVAAVKGADLAVLTDLVESGQVRPVIDRKYPLSEVAEAIRYMQAGRARGKVVITIAGADLS
jgi:NADPH:quinone reductase-like Zn-dependent oxidoreductase